MRGKDVEVIKQVKECLRALNVLHDTINRYHYDNWDLGWELDQVESAKIQIEKLIPESPEPEEGEECY